MYFYSKILRVLKKKIRIGTRGSRLALWQADFTQKELAAIGVESELVVIKTKGDKIQQLGFDKIEGKGFFTKEIEEALLNRTIDMAVHSMKDLPTTSPQGLVIAAISKRENAADWLLIRRDATKKKELFQLKQGALVGTSSARRKAQLLDFRQDVRIKDIRGNVPTRLAKLGAGGFDAILLAAAGLSRLGLDISEFQLVKFNPREFIPAPAQGVLAFQTRDEDGNIRGILAHLHHPEVSSLIQVERRVLHLLEGGCHMPLGVYCERDPDGRFQVYAAKAERWDTPVKRVQISSASDELPAEQVVEALLKKQIC